MRTHDRMYLAAAASVVALTLTECGSRPPTAAGLAGKIPGCGQLANATPASFVQQDVTCTFTDSQGASVNVEVATFTGSADELKWISDGGTPSSPDPGYGGCCIQGNDWAATVDSHTIGTGSADFHTVMSAIGGREV